ncbi:Hypothetical predicted protein [Cloeon dipterum]|uniref:Chitin-binding type-2 domain-containing protein n=1 Tax=Cloeon dipterum TaxID=197152 RepID=A0A8S1DUZ6_9INSE|nr:Hypothetical predicted protein [Cloeon dipterum]
MEDTLKMIVPLILALLVDMNHAQRLSCLDGFACVNDHQFVYCDEEISEPMNCPKSAKFQTICYGGSVGYGESNEDAGPCLREPVCTQSGAFSFTAATGAAKTPELCGAFFYCNQAGSNKFEVQTGVCDFGLEFSVKSGKCEPESVANCSRKGVTGPGEIAIEDPSLIPGEVESTDVKPAATVTPSKEVDDEAEYEYEYLDYEQSAKPTRPGKPGTCKKFISPDPSSCRHYFVCTRRNGQRRRKCPGNLLFNEQWRVCTRNVKCGTRKIN